MRQASGPSRVLQIGMGFMASRALLSAVELDLFSVLAARPLDGDGLRDRLGLHPRAARDLFDTLVALGLLVRSGEGMDTVYSNSAESGAFLVPGQADYVGGILQMAGNRLYGFWNRLTEALLTGEPQNEIRSGGGADAFAALYGDPVAAEGIVDAMAGVQHAAFAAFADSFDFSPYSSTCDVGGSGAALSIAIARRHAHLTCASLDLAPVTAVAQRRIAAAGLSDRIEAQVLDFATDVIPQAEVILMGNILHDWSEADRLMLIRKAYAALPPGGAFVAIESIIDDERRTNIEALLMSLNMLIETRAGANFSFAEFNDWCRIVGFDHTERLALTGGTSAVIAYR